MSAMSEAYNLDQVVAIINGTIEPTYFGGVDFRSPELMACDYALDACKESEYEIDQNQIEAHLDVLVENGAKFDYQEALKKAIHLMRAS